MYGVGSFEDFFPRKETNSAKHVGWHHTQTIHGTGRLTCIYHKNKAIHVGKYTSPMDDMGY